MSHPAEIDKLLARCGTVITYSPLRTEVSWSSYIPLPEGIRTYEIPPTASQDPLQEAKRAQETADNETIAIFIPGRRFDAIGTRHGQGGGWYDRFLSQVPQEWKRIGFCYTDQFSSTPLTREPWDQGMDYVVVIDRETDQLHLYSTQRT